MKRNLKILGIALGVAALLTISLGTTVLADDADETTGSAYCGASGCGMYAWQGSNGYGGMSSEVVSDFLGITVEELHELRLEGNSLADIAASKGISVDELVAVIMDGKIAAVEARVADGTITQEQADIMIQQMTERTTEAVNRTTTGPNGYRMGGKGGTGYGSANRAAGGRGATGMGNRFSTGNANCLATGTSY